MITLQDILRTKSDLLEGTKVKLVRHKDGRAEYRDIMKDKVALLEYQKEQPNDVFGECDYIISFVGMERQLSLLFGVFKVNGVEFQNGKYYYDLMPVQEFDDLVDRVVIDWGKGTRRWDHWHHKQQKEVVEILPKGSMGNFPGLLNFVLDSVVKL